MSGERMVWAAAFVSARSHGHDAASAAAIAAKCVASMQTIRTDQVSDAERAYLDDMLSAGADR
jgi:hypothetical protein